MELLITEFIIFLALIYDIVKKKFDEFIEQYKDIPRDPFVTFFGHSLDYIFKTPSEALKIGVEAIKRCGGTGLFVMGFNARIFITNPKDVEEILLNRKLTVKSDFYHFLKDWLGNGLILSDGEKWFQRRKIFSKSFHFKILEDFLEVFNKNGSIFVNHLEKSNGEVIDVFPKLALCALDIICETSMGVEINAQTNADSEYVKAVHEIGDIAAKRFFNILLQNDAIFRLTPIYYKQKKCLKVVHGFTDSVIIARREELLNEINGICQNENDKVKSGRKYGLLDVLLQSTIDGKPLSNLDIREEVDTFAFAGHGTVTSGVAFCLYNLAKYSEVQEKVYDEIQSIFGNEVDKPATQKDLNSLSYMDLVIKETMRIYPPVPLYGREVQEDIKINGKFIPKKTNLIVSAVIMGQMENIWDDPLAFRPERFLDENVTSNIFASVPFSAGYRNCIGQKFAMLEMKSIVSKTLRHYEISVSPGYEPVLIPELVLRTENGMMLQFRKRTTL